MQNELIPWIDRAMDSGSLTQADATRIRNELWALLAWKAEILSLGDSSIREEQAEELLRSLCFTISLALSPLTPEKAGEKLAARPLRALYREGVDRLYRRIERARAAYARAVETALPLDNLAYDDTLRNIGSFFDAYRPDLFAHDIPCMIDYPLTRPAEGLGVQFIEAYLAQWLRENGFLGMFEPGRVRRLLNAHFPDAREQVVNLFEPVAANALGLELLGSDPARLDMAREDGARVWAMSRALGEAGFRGRLAAAADALSSRTGADAALVRQAGEEVAARVLLLPPEGMGGVFTIAQETGSSGGIV